MEIQRETLGGGLDGRRQVEINAFLSAQALVLAQLATSGIRLTDETRPCILNVFLTLINACERLTRFSGDDAGPQPRLAPRRTLAVSA